MLQFACCIGLGVNVADLLHLQAAFQTDGIIKTSTNEENILCIGIFAGKPLDPLLVFQYPLNLIRQGCHLGEQL